MTSKQELIYDLSGKVMDVLARDEEKDLDELDSLGREIAALCYDALLQTNRALLVDKDGNIVGSVDLIGKATTWMMTELDWKRIVYEGLRIKP